ncbi:MAG: hypothetical protein EU548_05000 [Promethearchaeota archaeon]|nr:MAG: hypothetical protein EU548_05000 [Candidatus Lokiarchaeota archaeon]
MNGKSNLDTKKLHFFNQALEYFDYPSTNISKCIENSRQELSSNNSDLLRDEMLTELEHLKELIINNPDAKIKNLSESDRKLYFKFINTFSKCPICGNQNHYFHLKNFYFNEDKKDLKDSLLNLMRMTHKRVKFSYGVPCCDCFKMLFDED